MPILEKNFQNFSLVDVYYSRNKNQKIERLVKLTSCFEISDWKGSWSRYSDNWNQKNIKMMNFSFENKFEFWATIEEIYENCESLNFYDVNFENFYSSFVINTKKKIFKTFFKDYSRH